MGVASFAELNPHYGHEVVVSRYGPVDDPVNVAIECETCNTVLLDFNAPGHAEPDYGSARVVATAWSDDKRVEVTFDAADWFAHASDDDIVELADDSWGCAYSADRVAQHFEETTTKPLFDYLDVAGPMADGDPVGFECDVSEEQALAWIADYLAPHRPELMERLKGWYGDDGSSAGPREGH